MRKTTVNLVIDSVLMLLLGAMAGIGVLIEHVLIPGGKRWEVYGRNIDLRYLGLDRHHWGTIHYVIGIVFVGLVVVHILLHWKMVVGMSRRLPVRPATCTLVGLVLLLLTLFLALLPLLVKPEVREGGRRRGVGGLQGRRWGRYRN